MPRALGVRRDAMKRASGRRSQAGRVMIAGSLNRLRRKGCTASSESGPPRLNRTMAIFISNDERSRRRLPVAHRLDQLGDVLGRGLRHHAVAEIEDERAMAELVEDARRLALQGGPA